MVKYTVYMNDLMKKRYRQKTVHQTPMNRKIRSLVHKQLLNISKYEYEDKVWIAEKNQCISYAEIIQQYGTLSDYEWNMEFYFCKDLLNSNWRDSIESITYEFDRMLRKLNFGNEFVLTFIGQCGNFESLNVRLQLYRESELHLDQIDFFNEPIMVQIIKFN